MQTPIRLLLEEQSDQGLHCLLFHLHLFDKINTVYRKVPKFSDARKFAVINLNLNQGEQRLRVFRKSVDPDQIVHQQLLCFHCSVCKVLLPGREPTDVDDAPAPWHVNLNAADADDDDNDDN